VLLACNGRPAGGAVVAVCCGDCPDCLAMPVLDATRGLGCCCCAVAGDAAGAADEVCTRGCGCSARPGVPVRRCVAPWSLARACAAALRAKLRAALDNNLGACWLATASLDCSALTCSSLSGSVGPCSSLSPVTGPVLAVSANRLSAGLRGMMADCSTCLQLTSCLIGDATLLEWSVALPALRAACWAEASACCSLTLGLAANAPLVCLTCCCESDLARRRATVLAVRAARLFPAR
jgi:hypothetical protein